MKIIDEQDENQSKTSSQIIFQNSNTAFLEFSPPKPFVKVMWASNVEVSDYFGC